MGTVVLEVIYLPKVPKKYEFEMKIYRYTYIQKTIAFQIPRRKKADIMVFYVP